MVQWLTQDNIDLYGEFVSKNPMSTPFHTKEWMDLTAETFGFRPVCLIDMDGQKNISGVLPLFSVETLFGSKIVSLPLRDKGGGIYNKPETEGYLLDYAVDYAKKTNCSYINIKTNNPEEAHLLESKSFVRKDTWVVSYLQLEENFDETRRKFSDKRLSWSINKANKNNLKFEEGINPNDINDFYSIFVRNRKRLGVPPYSRRLFQNIYSYFIAKRSARLFFVSKEGVRITAIIIFLWNNKAYDVYSASLAEAFKYRANDFQMYFVLKWLCENGYREYDLGADSPFQEDLLNYKKKWGCKTKPLHYYYFFNRVKDVTIRDSDHPRYELLRRIWRYMPDVVFERLGGFLIKYLA
jgi:hypothetical protein